MGIFSRLFKKKDHIANYEKGLFKQREKFSSLQEIIKSKTLIDDELYDSLLELFVSTDMGIDTSIYFIEKVKKDAINRNLTNPKDLIELVVDNMFELYLNNEIVDSSLKYDEGVLNVYLFVGVNGSGKTTSIGKIAKIFTDLGRKTMIIAADTFRAAAVLQVSIWATRSNCFVFDKGMGHDPSAVIYEGINLALKENYEVVLIDTAGRLQNKVNLMKELEKMKNVINKVSPLSLKETLLVIDATTGQNGVSQAKIFKETTDVTGIILTKLDGTSKGGIIMSIRHLYNIPIKYIGLGEKIDDLVLFDIEEYIYSLFKELK
ncbi:MAG: signal recognition particle-docking protein FtsY [Acholeplasmatales bacterium]|jgi:fused signal recognition particle receptor|nr:signal recognition particle-docking protein FtsY [Acholeplasmatales bacterium]